MAWSKTFLILNDNFITWCFKLFDLVPQLFIWISYLSVSIIFPSELSGWFDKFLKSSFQEGKSSRKAKKVKAIKHFFAEYGFVIITVN